MTVGDVTDISAIGEGERYRGLTHSSIHSSIHASVRASIHANIHASIHGSIKSQCP